jgi:hypothetical protein
MILFRQRENIFGVFLSKGAFFMKIGRTVFPILFGFFLLCRQAENCNSVLQSFIGMDYERFDKISLNLPHDNCSPYTKFRTDFETDSTIDYLYLSKECLDAAFEIRVNKKSNKIMFVKPKNMS